MPIRKDRKLKAVKAEFGAAESLATAAGTINPMDAAPLTEAITIADILAAAPNEDALEALLDEESDADFGLPNADATPRAVLKEWTAQDFSNIYTRFRPHLERHARRFLSNQSQVDEVVQDAFLYLMVTLPELDSEIGVLRFMKWKVRLLCLDVIRASGRAYVNNIDDIAEPESLDPEVGSELEHIEDAAIVRLALAKLNPRHREVLLASMYEEKSAAQIAAQVGLSENATRQLIFRARAAFKTALLGSDVDTTGMSVNAILSVAARKAAAEAKKVGAQAMVLVLFMMLAVGAVINFTGSRDTQTSTVAEGSSAPSAAPSDSASAKAIAAPAAKTGATEKNADEIKTPKAPASELPVTASQIRWETGTIPTPSESPIMSYRVNKLFQAASSDGLLAQTKDSAGNTIYRSYSDQGIFADFKFDDSLSDPLDGLQLSFMVGNAPYFATPSDAEMYRAIDKDGFEHIVYYADLSQIVDRDGVLHSESKLAKSTMRLELTLGKISRLPEAIELIVLSN